MNGAYIETKHGVTLGKLKTDLSIIMSLNGKQL